MRRGGSERSQRPATPGSPGERREGACVRPRHAARDPVDDRAHGMAKRMGDTAPAIARAMVRTGDEGPEPERRSIDGMVELGI